MANSPDNLSMALFCDFENVALGVRDAQFDKFDIKRVLERLLLKGSIVVKKAYCDWERYKGFKSTMHEANFELIEIPHVRQSGKNSADIRLVVDALDLCYTKSHVNTFVIISGDSDFSPLVSKLRENAKTVIGVGVKQSTSDLLIANCDEFIFYDDLVRESQRAADQRATQAAARPKPQGDDRRRKDDLETRRTTAVELASETFDALVAERGDSGKIWASVLKEAIKRRRPDFNESYFGFRAFGNLLEEAQSRGLLEFGRDEKSGTYVYRSHTASDSTDASVPSALESIDGVTAIDSATPGKPTRDSGTEPRRRSRGTRSNSRRRTSEDTRADSVSDENVSTAERSDTDAQSYTQTRAPLPEQTAAPAQPAADMSGSDAPTSDLPAKPSQRGSRRTTGRSSKGTSADQASPQSAQSDDPFGDSTRASSAIAVRSPTERSSTDSPVKNSPFIEPTRAVSDQATSRTPGTASVQASSDVPVEPAAQGKPNTRSRLTTTADRPARKPRAASKAASDSSALPSTTSGTVEAGAASAIPAPATPPSAAAATAAAASAAAAPAAAPSKPQAAPSPRKTPARPRRPRKTPASTGDA